ESARTRGGLARFDHEDDQRVEVRAGGAGRRKERAAAVTAARMNQAGTPTITWLALISAVAGSPGARCSSATALLVTIAEITVPPGSRTPTSLFTAPLTTVATSPAN